MSPIRAVLVAATVVSCSSVFEPAAHPSPASDAAAAHGPIAVDLDRMEHDAAYVIERNEAAVQHLMSLPAAEQQIVRDAWSHLVANCPYTRARVMAVMGLEHQLAQVMIDEQPAAARGRLETVVAAAHAQAEVFRAVGAADLPPPLPTDYLHDAVITVSAVELLQAQDPVQVALDALDAVNPAVQAMPRQTQDGIGAAWTAIHSRMAPDAIFFLNERHIRDILSTVDDESPDPAVSRVIELVDELHWHNC